MSSPAGHCDVYGRYLRVRALQRHVSALGPRIALLRCADLERDPGLRARVCVRIGDSASDQVRAEAVRLPIQSGALTGLVAGGVIGALSGEALRAFADEAHRVLQPGGTVVLFGAITPTPEVVEGLVAALTVAGLELSERRALRTEGAATRWPPLLWPIAAAWDARHATRASPTAVRVECVLAASRPGGLGPEIPTAGDLSRAWFFGTRSRKPRGWRRDEA